MKYSIDETTAKTLGTFLFVIVAVIMILGIMNIVGRWKVLQKAGRPGWHALIPVLTDYTLYGICWQGMYGIIRFALLTVSQAQFTVNGETPPAFMAVTAAASIAALAVHAIMCKKLADIFGKGIGFTVGLIFLEPIFMLILGCGDAEYGSGYVKDKAERNEPTVFDV